MDRLDLAVRPRQDDFESEIQPLLERMGCSRQGGCHTQAVGELQIVSSPGATDLQANYLGVKSKADLDDPDASLILTYLLPGGGHFPACWASTRACAWRKLRAWIAWTDAASPRPQDVDCDSAGEACPP